MKLINKINENGVILFLIIILGFIAYFSYIVYIEKPKLNDKYLKDYITVVGKFHSLYGEIPEFTTTSKVSYEIEGKTYYFEMTYQSPCRLSDATSKKSRNEILQFKFPVAVSKILPTYALPLIRPKDFKVINRPFPDSLKLMYNKYFNCTFWESINLDD